jgi:hypothetical protein
MGILTDEWEVKLLKHIFGHTKLDIPGNLYLGLHSGTPTEASPSTGELSGSGYSRYHLVDNVHNTDQTSSTSQMHTRFGFSTNDSLTNTTAIDFPEATGSWGTVTHYSVWDDATATTAANCLMIGALSSGVAVGSGDQFRIAVGEFDLTFPAKMGVGAGAMATSTVISSSAITMSYEYHYHTATEWRRQVARRLGFINEPWGHYQGLYDFAALTDQGNADQNRVVGNRNGYFPNVSLAYYTDAYNMREDVTQNGSVIPTDVYADSLYLGLYKGDPGNHPTVVTAGGSTDELNGNGYARQQLLTKGGSNVFGTPATSGGVSSVATTSAIAFPEATADWGSITHWGIYRGNNTSYGTAGPVSQYYGSAIDQHNPARHPFLTGALTTARTVNSGDILRFGIGDFVIKLD